MEEDTPSLAPKPNPFTTVTPFSKTLALILFITLPFVGFYLGVVYQSETSTTSPSNVREAGPLLNPPRTQTSSESAFNNETSDWRTYTYPDFSVRLPGKWFDGWPGDPAHPNSYIRLTNYNPDPNVGPARSFSLEGQVPERFLDIEVWISNYDGSLDNYLVKKRKEEEEVFGEQSYRDTKLRVDGEFAIKAVRVEPGPTEGPDFVVYLKHPRKSVVIALSFYENFAKHAGLSEQILSTFKFLP